MLHQQVPVRIDVPGQAQTRALIEAVIEIFFNQIGIDRGFVEDGVRGRLGLRVDGRVGGERAGHVVDIAALIDVVERGAEGQLVLDDRDIHIGLDAVRHLAVLGEGHGGVEAGAETVKLRLVGDQADRAGLRGRAIERALRSGQHLDPFKVGGVDVQVTARRGDRLFVQIQRDVGRGALGAGQLHADRLHGHAADIDRILSRSASGEGDVGQLANIIGEIADIQFVERFLINGLDRDGNGLGGGGPLGRRDGNLVNLGVGGAGRHGDGGGRKNCGCKCALL